LNINQQQEVILGNLSQATTMLQESAEFALLMPEVRVNIVYALRPVQAKMSPPLTAE
jgi:predicted fused transcriptional regulator/phosphomethylpyrimidine kinase